MGRVLLRIRSNQRQAEAVYLHLKTELLLFFNMETPRNIFLCGQMSVTAQQTAVVQQIPILFSFTKNGLLFSTTLMQSNQVFGQHTLHKTSSTNLQPPSGSRAADYRLHNGGSMYLGISKTQTPAARKNLHRNFIVYKGLASSGRPTHN